MKTLKLNISYIERKKLNEAAEFYGIQLNEVYNQMVDNYLAEFRTCQTVNAKTPTKRSQKKALRELSMAHKREERKRKKERKSKSSEITVFSSIKNEVVR